MLVDLTIPAQGTDFAQSLTELALVFKIQHMDSGLTLLVMHVPLSIQVHNAGYLVRCMQESLVQALPMAYVRTVSAYAVQGIVVLRANYRVFHARTVPVGTGAPLAIMSAQEEHQLLAPIKEHATRR